MKKKIMFALLLGILVIALNGCGKQKAERDIVSTAPNTHDQIGEQPNATTSAKDTPGAEFAGEWKANKVLKCFADERGTVKEYFASVLTLNEDGTGTFEDYILTWEYSHEYNTIKVQFPDANTSGALGIKEVDGKTVLDFWGDLYYRSSDFVAKGIEIQPD